MSEDNITVTLKGGDEYGKPWITFKGSMSERISKDMCQAFGLDLDAHKDLPLHQVAMICNQAWQAGEAIASNLGGQVITEQDTQAVVNQAVREAEADKPKPKDPEPEPTQPEVDWSWLKAEIDAASSVDEVKKVWVKRRKEIDAAKLSDYWKAKASALKAKEEGR